MFIRRHIVFKKDKKLNILMFRIWHYWIALNYKLSWALSFLTELSKIEEVCQKKFNILTIWMKLPITYLVIEYDRIISRFHIFCRLPVQNILTLLYDSRILIISRIHQNIFGPASFFSFLFFSFLSYSELFNILNIHSRIHSHLNIIDWLR